MANGSTRVNATYTTSGAVGDYIQFNWSSASSSVTGNYTDVSWSLVLYSLANGQIYSSASKSWSVTVNGSTYSGTNTIGIGNNTSKTLASGSTRIYHNADGTKSFSYSFSQTFNITFNSWVGTVSGSSSGTLDKIPRYAAIKSFSFSDITQTSATCSWTADSNCSKIDYYVNGTLHNSVSISSSSGTYTLDHLSHSTLYSVYFVLTRMDSGLTTQSETKSFTTQPITSLLPEQTFSFTVGEDLTLSFQNPDMNSSMLKLSLENDDGEWINDVISTEVPVGTVSYDWELSAYSDLLYGYCKTRNMMNIRISCGVILDGNYQDNKYTGTALIANSNPVFHSCVLTNTDDTIATLLGSSSSVESWGNFQIQIPPEQKAVAQNGAEIVKYIADMISSPDSSTSIKSAEAAYSSDSQVNLDLGNYTEPGTYLICVYAIDSRKNTSEIVQIPCTIYPYHVPTSSIFLQRMNGFEKEIFLSLSILHQY